MQRSRLWKCICAGIMCILMLGSCVSVKSAEKSAHNDMPSQTEKERKDTLLIFTGSDWSKENKTFSQTIITDALKTALEKKYTVRYIDLLRTPAEHEREAAQKNYLLFSEYAVPEVPFIVLETFDHDIYAAYTVEPDIKTDTQLIEKIASFAVQREKIAEARRLIDTTNGFEKAQAIDSFLNAVHNPESRRYDSLRKQVPQLDPHNKSGLKSKYVLIGADMNAKSFAHKGDFINAGNEYKKAAETGVLEASELQLAWYFAAYSYLMAGTVDTQTIIGYLRKAVEADPHNAGVTQIEQAIKKLQQTSGQ